MKKTYILAALLTLLSLPAFATVDRIDPNVIVGSTYLVDRFGVNCDGVELTDVTTIAGSPVISSASYDFTQKDVGKLISVKAAAASGNVLTSTIISVSGGEATIGANAAVGISGTASAMFGTDVSTSINRVSSLITNGGIVKFPDKVCVVSSSLSVANKTRYEGFGTGASTIAWIGPMSSAIFSDTDGSWSNTLDNVVFRDMTLDAGYGYQTIGSGNSNAKAIHVKYMVSPIIENLYVKDTPFTSIGADFMKSGKIRNNLVEGSGRYYVSGGGGAAIGISVSNETDESYEISGNTIKDPHGPYGVYLENQLGYTATNSRAIVTKNNLIMTSATATHGIYEGGMSNTIISENNIIGSGHSNATYAGIYLNGAVVGSPVGPAGTKVINNNIVNMSNGIAAKLSAGYPTLAQTDYTIEGNTITDAAQSAIKILIGTAYDTRGIYIRGNKVKNSGNSGIRVVSSPTGGVLRNLDISGNDVEHSSSASSNTYYGISIEAVGTLSRATIRNNKAYDSYTTPSQRYGINIGNTTGTYIEVADNYMHGNATGSLLLNTVTMSSSVIKDNFGYNPVGPSAVTPAASPWTYTSGTSPETLYLYGGTVSSVTIGGVQVASSSPATIELPPNVAAVITYSSAPTASKYVK